MTIDHFERELKRLRETFPGGDKFYTPHRIAMLWKRIGKDADDAWFSHIIEEAIDTQRTAPLPRWFYDKWSEELNNRKTRQYQAEAGAGSYYDQLQNAYDPKEYDDPAVRERIEGRIKLVKDLTTGVISKKQFKQGCDFFDAQMNKGKSLALQTKNP